MHLLVYGSAIFVLLPKLHRAASAPRVRPTRPTKLDVSNPLVQRVRGLDQFCPSAINQLRAQTPCSLGKNVHGLKNQPSARRVALQRE